MRVASFDRQYRLLLPSHSMQTLIDENNYCSQLTESINNVKYESITAQGVLAQLNVHIKIRIQLL